MAETPESSPAVSEPEKTAPVAKRAPALSALAVVALVMGVVPCCPYVSIVGCTLGVVAFQRVKMSNGRLRGLGLAKAAMAAGLGVSLLSGSLLWWYASVMQQHIDETIAVRLQEVFAAKDGTLPAAYAAMTDDSALPLSAEDIQTFAAQAEERYGEYRGFSVTLITSRNVGLLPAYDVAGVYEFEGGRHTGGAKFESRLSGSLLPDLVVTGVLVEDTAAGDLELPPTEAVSPDGATSEPAAP